MNLQKKAINLLQYSGTNNWCVTGAAGFIGSSLVEALLMHDQIVVGVDNFSSGKIENIEQALENVHPSLRKNFNMIRGSVLNLNVCKEALQNVNILLHQAASISVNESMVNPFKITNNNVLGFLNLLNICKSRNIRIAYASSSSVYGDCIQGKFGLKEVDEGNLLSPYGISKKVNELHAKFFSENYQLSIAGLRYFNVYGERQSPEGEYAGIIAKWISLAKKNKNLIIFGDGTNSRDFCYIADVVSANILATLQNQNGIFNIASGNSTSINELGALFNEIFINNENVVKSVIYKESRDGEIKHSLASIAKSEQSLGYKPDWNLKDGLQYLRGVLK
jgi:UDP-N-acetylglucosamine 4-epimerase